jgi:hypothetical protein
LDEYEKLALDCLAEIVKTGTKPGVQIKLDAAKAILAYVSHAKTFGGVPGTRQPKEPASEE